MSVILKNALIFLLISYVEGRGINGGFSCAACTIVSGIADQLAQIHNETILAAAMRLCVMLPSAVEMYCIHVVQTLEPILINPKLSQIFTPDVFCYGIEICYLDPKKTYCHLFPKPQANFRDVTREMKKLVAQSYNKNVIQEYFERLSFDLCKIPGIHEVCDLLNRSFSHIVPAVDADGDWYSIVNAARGAHWRGRDCRDWDLDSYPGRRPMNGDDDDDYNCNGIWGIDHKSGKTWEEVLCDNFDSRGVIYIGDSVGAHFHFPEPWINPLLISQETLHNYTEPLLDELDWPHLGFVTGFMNSSQPLLIKGVTDSLYLKLRSRNKCNHRDYQNLSQNGASSFDGMTYVNSVSRKQTQDKPALVFYGMFGNDVCNRFPDPEVHMTSRKQLHKNVMYILNILNNKLPHGSFVILVGLVDGGFIYPTMANRIHPLGQLRGNIHYHDVYTWFNCMEMGPCSSWMNSNVTLRKLASQRAQELTEELKLIVASEKFSSFSLYYLDNPVLKVMWEWKRLGKPLWQLLDPVDSLHPSQLAQPLLAKVMWEDIMKTFPEALGDENPNNGRIQELFGDQGGH